MERLCMQLRIWWLMFAVAIVAVLCAWLDPLDFLASVCLVLVVLIPAASAPPRHRILVTTWFLSLYPLMVPICLFTTWLTAWYVLGHRPRHSVDDPKYISWIVAVPFRMTCMSLLVCLISFWSGLVLVGGWSRRRLSIKPLVVLPCVWLSVLAILCSDPLGIGGWFVD